MNDEDLVRRCNVNRLATGTILSLLVLDPGYEREIHELYVYRIRKHSSVSYWFLTGPSLRGLLHTEIGRRR